MPKLTVEGVGEFQVPDGKRLVLALTDEAGVDQVHACGGQSRCTTCRVAILDGEPAQMTVAEQETLRVRELTDARLSCQVLCSEDMTVQVLSRVEGSGRADAGTRPAEVLEPAPAQWVDQD